MQQILSIPSILEERSIPRSKTKQGVSSAYNHKRRKRYEPGYISSFSHSISPTCWILRFVAHEIHLRHDINPRDLKVDHRGHGWEYSAIMNNKKHKIRLIDFVSQFDPNSLQGRKNFNTPHIPKELVFVLHELRIQQINGARSESKLG